MFQPIYKFIELLYKEEEDSSVSLISFFRALGIHDFKFEEVAQEINNEIEKIINSDKYNLGL